MCFVKTLPKNHDNHIADLKCWSDIWVLRCGWFKEKEPAKNDTFWLDHAWHLNWKPVTSAFSRKRNGNKLMRAWQASVAGEECLFHAFPYLCRSDGEGLQRPWTKQNQQFGKIGLCSKWMKILYPLWFHLPFSILLSYHFVSFHLRLFCSFSTLQRHQMHKVMYMKEPAPEAPHLRTFRVGR